MKGFIYSKQIILIGCFLSFLNYFVYSINNKQEHKNVYTEIHRKQKITDSYQIKKILWTILVVVITIFILLKALFFFWVSGILIFISITLLTIFNVTEYFLIPSDIAWNNEKTFELVYFSLVFFICYPILLYKLYYPLSNTGNALSDFFIAISLIIWYGISLFLYISHFFIISEYIFNLMKKSAIKNKIHFFLKKPLNETKWEITPYNDIFTPNDLLDNIIYFIFYTLCVVIDLLIISFSDSVIMTYKSIYLLIKKGYSIINRVFIFLQRTPGIKLVISFRFAFIISILLVHSVDKYMQIFSPAGSNVFEYVGSVIVIPLIISQVNEIRNSKK